MKIIFLKSLPVILLFTVFSVHAQQNDQWTFIIGRSIRPKRIMYIV